MLEISNVKNDKNKIELDFSGLETGVKKHLKCNTENYKQICNYIGSNLNNDEFQYLVNFFENHFIYRDSNSIYNHDLILRRQKFKYWDLLILKFKIPSFFKNSCNTTYLQIYYNHEFGFLSDRTFFMNIINSLIGSHKLNTYIFKQIAENFKCNLVLNKYWGKYELICANFNKANDIYCISEAMCAYIGVCCYLLMK